MCYLSVLATENPANQNLKDDNARVRDLSAGGARIATHKRLDMGDRVLLKFVPQAEEGKDSQSKTPPPMAASRTATPVRSIAKPALPPVHAAPARNNAAPNPGHPSEIIEVRGRVVRVSVPPGDADPIISLGVEFQEMNNRLQDRLVNLVFETQRAQCQRR